MRFLANILVAAVSGGLVAGAVLYAAPAPPAPADKHDWPGLTASQKADLAESFKKIAGLKLDIVCGDGACTDLAQDVDDAAEKAGVSSVLDRPIAPIGYGIGVMSSGDAAKSVADAIQAATGGKLKPSFGINARTYGYAVLSIGKYRKD